MKKRVLITVIAPAVVLSLIVISAKVVQERREAAQNRPPSRHEQLVAARKFFTQQINRWSLPQATTDLGRKDINYHLERYQLALSKVDQGLENQNVPCWMPLTAIAFKTDAKHPWFLEFYWLDADGLGDSIELENTDGSIGRISLRPTTAGDVRYYSVTAFRETGFNIENRAGPLTIVKGQTYMEVGEIAMPVAKLKKDAKIVLISPDGSRSEAAPVLVVEYPAATTESITRPATSESRESDKVGPLGRDKESRE